MSSNSLENIDLDSPLLNFADVNNELLINREESNLLFFKYYCFYHLI